MAERACVAYGRIQVRIRPDGEVVTSRPTIHTHTGSRALSEDRKPRNGQVAPGGVEPPHTDSKSVALSSELRGRGLRRVDGIRERISGRGGLEIVDEDARHSLARLLGRAAEMRREDDVRKVEQLVRHGRFVGEDVEPGPEP